MYLSFEMKAHKSKAWWFLTAQRCSHASGTPLQMAMSEITQPLLDGPLVHMFMIPGGSVLGPVVQK